MLISERGMQTYVTLQRSPLVPVVRGTHWPLQWRPLHLSRANSPGSDATKPTSPATRPLPSSATVLQVQPQKNSSDSATRAQVKARLRQLVSKVNVAALPGPADLAALDATIGELIQLNPIPDSATSDLINGRWVLLYTANSATLRQASAASSSGSRRQSPGSSSSAYVGTSGSSSSGSGNGGSDGGLEAALSPLQLANDIAYRFFYTYLPVLAGAAVGARGGSSVGPVKPRGNFQVIDTRAGKVENQARIALLGDRLCCINVNGTAEVVQCKPGLPRQRLRAVFTSFDLLLDGRPRLSLPLSLLNPVGFVDTPYLDEEIRISFGDKGSVFIAARDNSSS